jgi:hypothetical protein
MNGKMEEDLDFLLARMAAEPRPLPGPALMARLLEDAARLQPPGPMPAGGARPPAIPALPARPAAPRGGWIGALADLFGGRGALAGMMLATIAGLWLGVAQPISLSTLTGAAETPLESLDLFAGSDRLWTEAAQ